MARNWKRVYPSSVVEAMRLCKDHAQERRNLSVERIAELMGVTPDVLYKWLSTGRMPAVMIPVYEHACGISLVSRYLAASSGRLVIDIPTGRTANTESMQDLQQCLLDAVGKLFAYYKGEADAPQTVAATMAGLEQLAWHRHNVEQASTPQLDFGGDHE